MNSKIVIAGFGGQGIILAGKLLAYSAMLEGKEVTNFPSYGAEVRGGTCNCAVIVSDNMIASPIIDTPDILIVLNQPSKIKFESKLKENGIIILNSSIINEKTVKSNIKAYSVDATNLAATLGNTKIANMVMLGAFAKITNLIKLETIINALSEVISARNKSLIDLNKKALEEGYNLVK
jgi:2-oxoglutarate ferredoxin oxidoreductase subunit gamma